MNLNMNTIGSGHGKLIHDTLIDITKRKVPEGFKTPGIIPIVPEDSIAEKMCSWIVSVFAATPGKHDYKWQFVEVPEDAIMVANSPIDGILTEARRGITDHH